MITLGHMGYRTVDRLFDLPVNAGFNNEFGPSVAFFARRAPGCGGLRSPRGGRVRKRAPSGLRCRGSGVRNRAAARGRPGVVRRHRGPSQARGRVRQGEAHRRQRGRRRGCARSLAEQPVLSFLPPLRLARAWRGRYSAPPLVDGAGLGVLHHLRRIHRHQQSRCRPRDRSDHHHSGRQDHAGQGDRRRQQDRSRALESAGI